VAQLDFLGELRGFSSRTSRLKSFDLSAKKKPIIAEYAEDPAEFAEKFKLSHYPDPTA